MPERSDAIKFFFHHAGWSYAPATETSEAGRARGAKALADAERRAAESDVTFDWSTDAETTSADFSDVTPAWSLWQCVAYDADGAAIGSLGGIDLGRDGTPESVAYARVIQAEIALKALAKRSI